MKTDQCGLGWLFNKRGRESRVGRSGYLAYKVLEVLQLGVVNRKRRRYLIKQEEAQLVSFSGDIVVRKKARMYKICLIRERWL